MKKLLVLSLMFSSMTFAMSEKGSKISSDKSVCMHKAHFENMAKIDSLLEGRETTKKKKSRSSSR
jgi:hypothetical protein